MIYSAQIAAELKLPVAGVRAVLELLAAGNTVPFVARYRKEATGELDEVQIRDIRDRHEYLVDLDARREAVLASVEEQNQLTPGLRKSILRAVTKSELEDLYRPYKPKRRTRATIAAERGLVSLADLLWVGETSDAELNALAARYADPAGEVATADDALAGARDIVAERVADDAAVRARVRDLTRQRGVLQSRARAGREAETSKFQDYYDFSEPLRSIPGHRVLAMRRGEADAYLTVRVAAPEEEILSGLRQRFVAPSAAPVQMGAAVADAYRRLLAPSVEAELRAELKGDADEEAIRIFGSNLEALLLAPPAGQRVVLGVDPGYRTGCKLAVVGGTGTLLATGHIYLHQEDRAARELAQMVEQHGVELVAVGNGTASREAEALVRTALTGLPPDRRPTSVSVNEAGASVYSASDVAREEFPDLDLTLRSAVSIARRLQDPLSELVKIDPKSIGVGQYQHDVAAAKLKRRLDETVESCVNRVGVEVNTASSALLGYVAGIGPSLAQRIVEFRDAGGPLASRAALRTVPGLGPKTFEQAAGFLRVRDGEHPLDASAVHPERYALVERMARQLGEPLHRLVGRDEMVNRIDPGAYVGEGVGLPTLQDILAELRKPGRDPRNVFEAPRFREDVNTLGDLRDGMILQGTVTNVVAFGAFVDVGVHQDGLVHVSQLSDRFISDPADVVRTGDRVTVRVLSVDEARKRISLSMKSADSARSAPTTKSGVKAETIRPGVAANGMRVTRR